MACSTAASDETVVSTSAPKATDGVGAPGKPQRSNKGNGTTYFFAGISISNI